MSEELREHYSQLVRDYLNAPVGSDLKTRRYGRMVEAELMMTEFMHISGDKVADLYDLIYAAWMSDSVTAA